MTPPSKFPSLSDASFADTSTPAIAARDSNSRMRRFVLLLLIANSISALLFIAVVRRPVFDDVFNFPDVQRYAAQGVNLATIRAHINPTGPGSFIWMAAAVRLLGGDALRDARLSVLASWWLLAAGVLLGARYADDAQLWYAAFAVALVFPHTMTATAAVLTEGPAMFCALLGALAWVNFTASRTPAARGILLGILGGLLIGLAVTCRQYYVALLPAAALLALTVWLRDSGPGAGIGAARVASTALALAVAIAPMFLLILAWKGLSPPGMVSGRSYQAWQSKVGLNLFRPVIAAFYVALYLVPLTLPAVLRVRLGRYAAIAVALIGAIVAVPFAPRVLQPGPLQSVLQAAAAKLHVPLAILFALIAGMAIYNAYLSATVFWKERRRILDSPAIVFGILTIVFFIAEQIGIGGNIPFYEVYILQMAPFLGLVAFGLLPRLDFQRIVPLLLLWFTSNVLLWRYAIHP